MIDPNAEHVRTLAEAAASLPRWRGRRVQCSTICRWIDRGVMVGDRRVRLEAVRIGGRRATSREAIARFQEATTARAEDGAALPRPATARLRQSEAAGKRLAAAGI